jgi:hypothetical protein
VIHRRAFPLQSAIFQVKVIGSGDGRHTRPLGTVDPMDPRSTATDRLARRHRRIVYELLRRDILSGRPDPTERRDSILELVRERRRQYLAPRMQPAEGRE